MEDWGSIERDEKALARRRQLPHPDTVSGLVDNEEPPTELAPTQASEPPRHEPPRPEPPREREIDDRDSDSSSEMGTWDWASLVVQLGLFNEMLAKYLAVAAAWAKTLDASIATFAERLKRKVESFEIEATALSNEVIWTLGHDEQPAEIVSRSGYYQTIRNRFDHCVSTWLKIEAEMEKFRDASHDEHVQRWQDLD